MSIRVALHHRTSYDYDRLVGLGPQIIRLRPAPHTRTPILSYSLRVTPDAHFINWQQDPFGNYQARIVFPEQTRKLEVEVGLVADMTVINPFDFFVDASADQFPFRYDPDLRLELAPYLEQEAACPELDAFLESLELTGGNTVTFITNLNGLVQQRIRYLIRHEPGVQTPRETLESRCGSCRDSAWLLVQLLRRLGLAARFVSGYLIQLVPDVKSLDGPSGASEDFTDLHAWTEVFLPGAGWVGLDPTSGLLAGEGHIPLAATPRPQSAAPISGGVDPCEVEFQFYMAIERIHEDPRVTKPYTASQWEQIDSLGRAVDDRLSEDDVRLTMGGEPTFVSIDHPDLPEWNTDAVGADKLERSTELLRRLHETTSPGGILHYGQGKWYPGESLPRWALGCYWRTDGVPLWKNSDLLGTPSIPPRLPAPQPGAFIESVAKRLGVTHEYSQPVYEDLAHFIVKERRLPVGVDPTDPKLDNAEERARLAKVFERGVGKPVGWVLPLQRQWWQGRARWATSPWPTRSERLFLIPGDSPIGLRLPLDSLPAATDADTYTLYEQDPTEARRPLDAPLQRHLRQEPDTHAERMHREEEAPREQPWSGTPSKEGAQVRTALCTEIRDGLLYVFLPPVPTLEDFVELVAAIEDAAEESKTPVVLEGYPPPTDSRISSFKVTPDPGVIEVNLQPTGTWSDQVAVTKNLYEQARLSRLRTEKFDLDGKHTGTGGGNHVVLGGATPLDSPFLRRPDLLRSFVAFWNNHPSLSYLFSSRFVGPTSQSPRVDEGRRDSLQELSIAMEQIPSAGQECPPWLVDRVFRNLLVDLTGNTHRAEICIDKLYSPDSSTGRLGLVEFRAFEMPPHAEMSLVQALLVRALVSSFWRNPYQEPLVTWADALHDRYLLPHFVWSDLLDVVSYVRREGIELRAEWFAPHFEFRFPFVGEIERDDIRLQLRTAIEPWYVLGEEPAGGGTVRFVDSSMERLELKAYGLSPERHCVLLNGARLPLHPVSQSGDYVAGVRYRAWQPASCLHPTIGVHTPLRFDLVDIRSARAIGGCTYHVSHPAGRNYESFPVNAFEADARRGARFITHDHTAGEIHIDQAANWMSRAVTTDLRRKDWSR